MQNLADLVGRTRRDDQAQLRLGIPVYADPDVHPEIWDGVARAPAGSVVVINPDSGPGRSPDARYVARAVAARALGHAVYGYVDTAYGTRPRAAILADVVRHHGWFGVDGVFFDQVPGTADRLGQYDELTEVVRARGLAAALNMGQANVDPRFAAVADILAVFEGPWAEHAAARFPNWMHDPGRGAELWHLVFDAPDAQALEAALARAVAGPCDVVFVTDGAGPNPWHRLPAYWDHELALVGSAQPAGGDGAAVDATGAPLGHQLAPDAMERGDVGAGS